MLEATSIPTMLRPKASNVVPIPVPERSLAILREAVQDLTSGQLLTVAASLIGVAQEAAESHDDAVFFDRVKAAYAVLDRILQEGGRI